MLFRVAKNEKMTKQKIDNNPKKNIYFYEINVKKILEQSMSRIVFDKNVLVLNYHYLVENHFFLLKAWLKAYYIFLGNILIEVASHFSGFNDKQQNKIFGK